MIPGETSDKGLVRFASTQGKERLLDLNKLGPTAVLLAIVLLGFGLRLHRLGDQNIWWDEGHAIWTARQRLTETTDITAHDVHPPLYLWMLHWWLALTGESEFAVRYLSVIGGMLTISLTYVVARRLIGRRAAMLATLLIATARFHIWWSQEARMYIWATFFALLSIHFFTRLRHAQTTTWWSYVLSSIAAMYTLYLSVLVLLLQNLFVAITVWRKPKSRQFLYHWGISQLSIMVLYTPWLYVALRYTRTGIAKTAFPFHQVWQLYGTVLATGISTDLGQYTWLLLTFGVLALAGIALLFFDRQQPQRYGFGGREIGLLLLLPIVTPPLVVYALSIPRGVFYSPKPEARYLLLFAPLFYILLAGTMAGFWQKGWHGRLMSVVSILLVLGTFVSVLPEYYVGRYLRDEYQTAMTTLAAYARPSDAVLVVSGDRYPIFLYYYNRRFPDGDGPPVYLLPEHSTLFTKDNAETELGPLAERHERLWLASVERTLQDPDNVAERWLDAHLTSVLHVSQGHNYLRLYADEGTRPVIDIRTAPPAQVVSGPVVGLGEGIAATGCDLPTAEFRPGDVVRPGIYAHARLQQSDTPDVAYRIVAEWVHSSGQIIERQTLDVPPVVDENHYVRVSPAFAVYEYTPPGRYWVELHGIEDSASQTRIPAGQVTQSRGLPARKVGTEHGATLGEERVTFLGYTVHPSSNVRAGRTLTVDLFWRAEHPLQRNYTVFVHLLGAYNPATGGPLWTQDDSYPLEGGHPTSRWQSGQTVPDRHTLDIPENTPPGVYQIEVGLYDASTGERLPVDGSDEDRIVLDSIQVVAR
jgi:4-amino-4-deoxy-L-arabinose transferase-like glycosyltransferase